MILFNSKIFADKLIKEMDDFNSAVRIISGLKKRWRCVKYNIRFLALQ